MGEAEEAEVRTMPLPVKLTDAELAIRAQELATSEQTLADAELRLEQLVESAKAGKKSVENEIADARAKVGRLARVVRDRKEDRDVPIMEEPDYEKGAVNTYRTDTHEIVATRGMTEGERQQSLFGRNKRKVN